MLWYLFTQAFQGRAHYRLSCYDRVTWVIVSKNCLPKTKLKMGRNFKIKEFELHCIQLSGFNVIVNFRELLERILGNSLERTLKLLPFMSRGIDRKVDEVLYWEDGVGALKTLFVDVGSYRNPIYYKIPNSTLTVESTNCLTFNNCTFCPHCIYVFCIYLRTNSDLCHLQHKLIGFYNADEKCLQRGTDWGFK